MIKGKTEKEYRAVKMDSSSSLKEFSTNRRKYHRKYVLGESTPEEEEDSKASITGRVVETLLLEPEEFDNRFYMSVCVSTPTGLMLDFVNALVRHTIVATDEFGNVSREFEEMCKDAYAESGFKIKFDAVINKFVGSDAEIYYKELREVKSKGLTVITTQDVTNAEAIVANLRSNEFTAEIVNMVDSGRYTVLNQFQVEGFTVNDHLFKAMMDKVIVDHNTRTITIYDLKCTWSVENFLEEYYLYRRAYIQACIYYLGMASFTHNPEHEWFGYTVDYPKFIVCDSTNYYTPLVYTLTASSIENAYNGFEHKNRTYPGVAEIIADLKWAIEMDRWDVSRENYNSNGIVNII